MKTINGAITSGLCLLALSLSLFWPAGTQAATIERFSEPLMGCTMLLSGKIAEGDTERLEAVLAERSRENPDEPMGRLCLNSTGGSFPEGVRLAQAIRGTHYLGTAIAQGHVCESACAIAFMAGGWTEGGYDSVRPIMHPQSRLGFHAPAIEIPRGQYTEQQVAQAWADALQAVAQIVEMRSGPLNVSDYYNFPERLLLEMLSTPPESMFYIDTVARAASFGIAVYPVGLNSLQPSDAFENLCMSASGWITSGPYDSPEIRGSAPGQIEAFFQEGFGEEAVGSCRVVLNRDRLHDRDVFLQSRGRPIAIEFNGDQDGGGEYASRSGGYSYMTFDGSTRLESLPVDMERTWREFADRVQISMTPSAP